MNQARKKQQWLIVGVVVLIAIFIFIVARGLLGNSPQTLLSGGSSGRIDTRIVADRTSGASPEDIWISNAETQISELSKQLALANANAVESTEKFSAQIADLEASVNAKVKDLEGNTADAVMNLAGRINEETPATPLGDLNEDVKLATVRGGPPLEEFVARTDSGEIEVPIQNGEAGQGDPNQSFRQDFVQDDLAVTERAPFVTSFALTPKPQSAPNAVRKRTLDSYVPAGSYAPAVVLTGADAKTGTENAANPIPVVLKLTGSAVGPSDGRVASNINLEGCRVMGSAIADLSSERVSVRLDAISCVRRGEVLEASLAGYVSGQGQQGVRGRLFSRAGPAIKNAAIASALEGVAGAVGGAGQTIVGLDSAGSSDVFEAAPAQAISGGAQGAASKLADYYIQRAEQISPVVSLFAGTEVNVVFLEGVDFSGE